MNINIFYDEKTAWNVQFSGIIDDNGKAYRYDSLTLEQALIIVEALAKLFLALNP